MRRFRTAELSRMGFGKMGDRRGMRGQRGKAGVIEREFGKGGLGGRIEGGKKGGAEPYEE
jgi:hypothetical protein